MGNCLRMPEDHSDLYFIPPTPLTSLPYSSSPSTESISTHPVSFMPKLVTLNRSPPDLNVIKAAQCQNLVEHLPLVNYNPQTIKQIECDICLVDFMLDELVRQMPCNGAHVFHPSCIDKWLEKSLTCPHCSTNVDAALLLRFLPNLSNNNNNNDDDDDDDCCI